MIWLTVASGTAAALRLVLTAAPRPANTVELAAVGWPPARLRAMTVAATAAVSGLVLIAGTALAGVVPDLYLTMQPLFCALAN